MNIVARRDMMIVFLIFLSKAILIAQSQWTVTSRSVISSPETFFPPQLPTSLKVPHYAPDPSHPNLRFWFTPDSFEQDSIADSTPVSLWRNVARIGLVAGIGNAPDIQTQSASPQQAEVLMQPTYANQPIYKKNALNGRGVVRFSREGASGSSGQKLAFYPSATSGTPGFVSNPFTSGTKEWTIFLVARTSQAIGDTGDMGILTAATNNDNEKGFHIYKSCSTCLANGGSAPNCYQGKFSKFSTINAKFGQTASPLVGGEVDENHCSDLCNSGCGADSVPANCAARWGPSGRRNLQDPDAQFRVITARAVRKASAGAPVIVSVFIDGFHSSSQPPGHLTGNAAANTYSDADAGITPPDISVLMLGVKAFADGSSPSYMSGDIAEMLVYNKALTVPEMDRVAHYLARKFALAGVRLDDGFASATRSVPLSCTNCGGPGPVGEAGTSYDSHLVLAAAYKSGSVTTVTSATEYTIVANGATLADLPGKVITFCTALACNTQVRGTALILTATGTDAAVVMTVANPVPGVTTTDGHFISTLDKCAQDWGAVGAAASTTQLTLVPSMLAGADAMAGLLLAVCAGVCTRSADASDRISNLRGSARVVSSTVGLVATLATPIPDVAAGDAYVLYNVHKVRLQPATNATGLAGASTAANDHFYSFAGHHLYFRPGGRCAGRGSRIVSYSGATGCAALGTAAELGDYLESTAVASADRAADGACRGANCDGPDTGGLGGAAAGHVSSIKVLGGALAGCTTAMTLSSAGSAAFTASVNTVSGGGAITSIAIKNHGGGFRGGSFTLKHGSKVGAVDTPGTQFRLATGSGSPTAANALKGATIVVCNAICDTSSLAAFVTDLRGSSVIDTSEAGAEPRVTVATAITGVAANDEYVLWGGPIVHADSADCKCGAAAFDSPALAHKSIPCLRATVGAWSDGQDGCAAGGAQDYLIVKDADHQAVRASGYLAGSNPITAAGTGDSGPAAGGTVFAARGAYLYPNDVRASAAASVTNVQLATGADALLSGQYLRVTFGTACSTNPHSDRYCLRSRPELEASACTLYNFPRGYDPAGLAPGTAVPAAAVDFSGIADLPEIRCVAPAGVGAQRDVNIYWHGISVTLAGWWHYAAPAVRAVVPAAGHYGGGGAVTVLGSNFGPQESWTTTSAGGAVRGEGVKAVVEIVGRSAAACRGTRWVSDGELVCELPPLPRRKQAVDIAGRKVAVQVVVTVDQQYSTQGPASAFAYTDVPAYYACEDALPAASRESCFTCCRSACIVDSFAQGGAQGMATMGNCDTACYGYCRYF